MREHATERKTDAACLTPRQRDALAFIAGYVKENGYPPVDREIAAGLGVRDTKTVHRHVDALAQKGFLTKDPDRKRSLALTERGMKECVNNARSPAQVQAEK